MIYLNCTMGNKISPTHFAHLIFLDVLNFVQSETFGGKMFSIELILVQLLVQATCPIEPIQLIQLIQQKQYFNLDFCAEESFIRHTFYCLQCTNPLATEMTTCYTC